MVINLYIAALIFTGLLNGWIAWYAYHRRSAPGSNELAILMALVSSWSLASAVESLATTYNWKVFWTVVSYPGNLLVSAVFLIFVLRYTQQDRRLKRKHITAVLILPIISVAMAATNHWHQLLWSSVTIEMVAGKPIAVYGHGPWFWIETIYNYACMAFAYVVLARSIFRFPELYSRQTRLLLLASLAPLAINILYAYSPQTLGGIDLTSIAFSFSGTLVTLAIFRYSLFDVTPVARDRLVEIIQEGMLVLDAQNRLVDCNPAGQKIFGWKKPPIGEYVNQLWAKQPDLLELCQAKQSQSSELSIQQENNITHFIFNVSLLRNRERKIIGRILLAHDISARRQAEAKLYLQTQALSAADNSIVITDTQGIVQWVNPAFTRLTGYSESEIIGQTTRMLKSGKQNDEYYQDLWKTIIDGKVWRGELTNRRKDGSNYYEEMTITPVIQDDGQISHFIAIKQDVSKRKQAEEALRMAHEEALEANRLKTQLLANVSHDLRTPMSAIIGFTDMLRSGIFGDVNERQVEAATEIMDSANNLVSFVNNLIGQAQLETGKIVIKSRPFETSELLEAARTAGNLIAKKKGLQLSFHMQKELPKTLYGDVYWLRQIVTNLISNAVKFTNHGEVNLNLWRLNNEHWAITVSDTGVGIPPDKQAIIFDAFQQADGSITRRYCGSGLGLSIVRDLTALMKGKVTLESEPGQGSTFTVTLPMKDSEETQT